MRILQLGNGGASLEFSPEEWPAVRDAMAVEGTITRTMYAAGDRLQVAGATFSFENEWDEPCLIASDPVSVAMLTAIYDRANHPDD